MLDIDLAAPLTDGWTKTFAAELLHEAGPRFKIAGCPMAKPSTKGGKSGQGSDEDGNGTTLPPDRRTPDSPSHSDRSIKMTSPDKRRSSSLSSLSSEERSPSPSDGSSTTPEETTFQAGGSDPGDRETSDGMEIDGAEISSDRGAGDGMEIDNDMESGGKATAGGDDGRQYAKWERIHD